MHYNVYVFKGETKESTLKHSTKYTWKKIKDQKHYTANQSDIYVLGLLYEAYTPDSTFGWLDISSALNVLW